MPYEDKGCELGSWLFDKLYLAREVFWAATKIEISLHDYIAEAQIWLAIICSQISPCTNITYVPDVRY